jgi:hypothetical protein
MFNKINRYDNQKKFPFHLELYQIIRKPRLTQLQNKVQHLQSSWRQEQTKHQPWKTYHEGGCLRHFRQRISVLVNEQQLKPELTAFEERENYPSGIYLQLNLNDWPTKENDLLK